MPCVHQGNTLPAAVVRTVERKQREYDNRHIVDKRLGARPPRPVSVGQPASRLTALPASEPVESTHQPPSRTAEVSQQPIGLSVSYQVSGRGSQAPDPEGLAGAWAAAGAGWCGGRVCECQSLSTGI